MQRGKGGTFTSEGTMALHAPASHGIQFLMVLMSNLFCMHAHFLCVSQVLIHHFVVESFGFAYIYMFMNA